MIPMNLVLDGDNCWPELVEKRQNGQLRETKSPMSVALLPGGMLSGAASVMIRFDLEDGTVVLGETSYALFEIAARGMKGRLEYLQEQNADRDIR